MVVRWGTSQPAISRVVVAPPTGPSRTLQGSSPTTDHQVTIPHLEPGTRYTYTLGTDQALFPADTAQFFVTPPPVGSKSPVRIWALGDFGSGTPNQFGVRDAFAQATRSRRADLWIWLGDNAYCCGWDEQFQQYVFDVYPQQLKNLPFYPTPGNHDYHEKTDDYNIPYYRLFTMPKQAEAGGVPSGSQAYHSFDYGNIHFISLDSFGREGGTHRLYDTTGRQVQWLKQDLAANRQPWTVVFFHHPPYSLGTRNGDTDPEMSQIRQKLLPILDRYNIDLVLLGHSHVYERSMLLKGFYGTAAQFNASFVVDGSSGRYDGSPNSCPIIRKGSGTVYVVAGSGGQLGGLVTNQQPGFPHPAMVYANSTIGGSLVIDVQDNRLDARWLTSDGSVRDQFTILKGVNRPSAQEIDPGSSVELTASWPGEYRWSGGQTSRSIRVSPTATTTYRVTDPQNCLLDSMTVVVRKPLVTGQPSGESWRVYPNPTTKNVTVELSLERPQDLVLTLLDVRGNALLRRRYRAVQTLHDEITLPGTPGVYLVRMQAGKRVWTRRVVKE